MNEKTNTVRLSKRQKNFLKVFELKACNISATCTDIGIGRATYYLWLSNNEKFREKVDDANNAILDLAESKLMDNIKKGKEASIFFFLKTKGKKRGYIETVEQNITVNPFLELMKSATSDDGT